MATPHSIKVRDTERASKYMAGSWGLMHCKGSCGLCDRHHGSPTMVHIRNMYISGVPSNFIPSIFDGVNATWTEEDMKHHAFHAGWAAKRNKVGHVVASEDTIAHMLMRRFFDSQHVVSGNSADKALEMLMKLWGLGKETTEIRAHVGFSWEQQMTRNRNNPGVVTIEDDNLGVEEGPVELQIEDLRNEEHAQAD